MKELHSDPGYMVVLRMLQGNIESVLSRNFKEGELEQIVSNIGRPTRQLYELTPQRWGTRKMMKVLLRASIAVKAFTLPRRKNCSARKGLCP